MIKNNTNSSLMTIVCAVAVIILSVAVNAAEEERVKPEKEFHGARVVNITADDLPLRDVTVQRGTTVVWLNNTKRILEIDFIGKQVTLACSSPVNFFVNDEGSYSSVKIMPNALSSLCFVQEGQYEYQVVVRTPPGPSSAIRKKLAGKVIVE